MAVCWDPGTASTKISLMTSGAATRTGGFRDICSPPATTPIPIPTGDSIGPSSRIDAAFPATGGRDQRRPQAIAAQTRSCREYQPILVTTSRAAIEPAISTLPVMNQLIANVSSVPNVRQVTALSTDLVCVSAPRNNKV